MPIRLTTWGQCWTRQGIGTWFPKRHWKTTLAGSGHFYSQVDMHMIRGIMPHLTWGRTSFAAQVWPITDYESQRISHWPSSLKPFKSLDYRVCYEVGFFTHRALSGTRSTHLCPKNLTFPDAKREQRCPRLVVVIFCLCFSICQSDLSFAVLNQSNS